MRYIAAFLLGLTFLFVSPAIASMRDAFAAAEILKDIAPVRVVRIDFSKSAEQISRVGGSAGRDGDATVTYGILFQFEQYLWIYTSEQGTRVLETARSDWTEPQVVVAALRRQGIPAVEVKVYRPPQQPAVLPNQITLPNACVIGALASLEELAAAGGPADAGLVLLSYHTGDAARSTSLLVDHCVLVYREYGRWNCVDPRTPDEIISLENVSVGAPVDPALLEIALRKRYPLKSVRLLTVDAGTMDEIRKNALWRKNRPQEEPSR